MGIVTRICNALPEMDSLCSVAFTIFGPSCIFLYLLRKFVVNDLAYQIGASLHLFSTQ